MKRKNIVIAVLFLVMLGFSLTGFNQRNQTLKAANNDTLPSKPEKKVRNLDEAINQVDLGFDELNKVDMSKIKLELESAMKELSDAKIQMKADKALQEVDLNKAKSELAKVMKDLDNGQIRSQLETALAQLNAEKLHKAMDLEKVQLERLQEQLKDIHPQIERSMKEARESLEKAKVELQDYKSFLSDLEKDGLIDAKSTYTIKVQDGFIIINGKKQGEEVNRKYQHFLKEHKEFTIEKSDDNFSIHNNK